MPLNDRRSASLVSHPSRGRWRGVLIGFQVFAGAAPSGFGQRHQRRDSTHAQRSLDLYLMLKNESFEHLLNHAEPQRHSLTQILAVELPAEVEDLDNQMLHKRGREAGLF